MRIGTVSAMLIVLASSQVAFAEGQPGTKIETNEKALGEKPKEITTKNSSCEVLNWQKDSNATNHATSWTYNRKNIPSSVTVYFNNGRDSSIYPIVWSWDVGYSGNPVNIELTADKLVLHIWRGAALHGTWNANTDTWSPYNDGYWAAVVCE